MTAASISPHNDSKMTTIILIVAVLLVGSFVGFLALTRSSKLDTRNRAQEVAPANTNTLPSKDAAGSAVPTRGANDTPNSLSPMIAPTNADAKLVPTIGTGEKPTGTICKEEGAICSWSASTGASTYKFQIIDTATGTIIKEGATADTKVSFTPLIDRTYSCVVTAVNACGDSPQAKASNTCKVTVTPTVGPSTTPTSMPSPTPTKTPGCDTPNSCIPSSQCKPGTQMSGISCGEGKVCCMPQSTPTPPPSTPAPTTQLPRTGMFEAPLIIIGISVAVIALGLVL